MRSKKLLILYAFLLIVAVVTMVQLWRLNQRPQEIGPRDYPEIKELYKKYELEKNEKELNDLGNRLSTYFIDLRFMAMYWNELLDYLGYDPTYIKMFIKIYNSKYDTMEDIKQPAEVRNLRAKEVDKAVRKAIWQYKIKHFWDK
jgi:hypothetical protein